MELRICPGIQKLYRLALVEEDDFTVLSEHDSLESAAQAKREAEAAASKAAADFLRIAA